VILLVLLALSAREALAQGRGSIVGTVRDAATRGPLAGVRVEALATAAASISAGDGAFAIRGLAAGHYIVRAQKIGYLVASDTSVMVGDTGSTRVELELERAPTRLADVIVTPGHFGVLQQELPSEQMLSREQLQTRPQIGEDIYRSVNRLPGVASSDYSARFSVRGGSGDELLVLLDGLELAEPFHLKDLDASLSIIDVQAIGGIDLITGGFPAQYGNRLTGIFDMRSLEDAPDDAHSSIGLSFSNARVRSQGAFARGNGRWLLSARRGYLDLLLKMINNKDDISPRYYDVLAKTEMRLGPNHVVAAHLLHAGDRLVFEEAPSRIESHYDNSYGWLTWRARLSQRLTAYTVASIGRLTWRRQGRDFEGGEQSFSLADDRRFLFAGLKQDWMFEATDRYLLKWGLEVRGLDMKYDYFNWRRRFSLENDQIVAVVDTTEMALVPRGRRLGLHAAQRLRLFTGLAVETGFRVDEQSYTHERRVDPRFNVAYSIGARTTLRAAWGRYSQPQEIYQLPVQDGDAVFRDAEVAEHRVLGIEHSPWSGLRVRVEGYQRKLTHIRPRSLSLSNDLDVFPEARLDRVHLAPERGEARGVELFVQRSGLGPVEWTASYALGKVEDEIAGGQVARPMDQRHTVYVDLGYRPSPKWRLGTAWQYHSGWPVTDIVFRDSTLANGSLVVVSTAGPLFAERLPAYHRLDVRATRYFDLHRGRLAVFVDVFNLYDHENVNGYEYDLSRNGGTLITRRLPLTMLPVLPSIGASWEF
jgi:hypothetical protein